jgi:hypothetical protein
MFLQVVAKVNVKLLLDTMSMDSLLEVFTKYTTNKMSIEDAKELIADVISQKDVTIFDFEQFLKCYFDK